MAELAIVKLSTPHETLHPEFFFGARQHEGDLDFKEDSEAFKKLQEIADQVPTVVIVDMDRPAILTNIRNLATGLIATFGADDGSLVEWLLHNNNAQELATGRLPFSLPKSMDSVRAQSVDKPLDDADPLYPMGFGFLGSD